MYTSLYLPDDALIVLYIYIYTFLLCFIVKHIPSASQKKLTYKYFSDNYNKFDYYIYLKYIVFEFNLNYFVLFYCLSFH